MPKASLFKCFNGSKSFLCFFFILLVVQKKKKKTHDVAKNNCHYIKIMQVYLWIKACYFVYSDKWSKTNPTSIIDSLYCILFKKKKKKKLEYKLRSFLVACINIVYNNSKHSWQFEHASVLPCINFLTRYLFKVASIISWFSKWEDWGMGIK